jgi:hypothetical protein
LIAVGGLVAFLSNILMWNAPFSKAVESVGIAIVVLGISVSVII